MARLGIVLQLAGGGLGAFACLRVVAQVAGCLLGSFTRLQVAGCRRRDATLGQAVACPGALRGAVGIEAAQGFTLFAAGQPAAELFAAGLVAIRHAVAVGGGMAPGAPIGIDLLAITVELPVVVELAIDIDVVVAIHVDVQVVAIPVAVAPEGIGNGDPGAEGQASGEGGADVVAGRRRIVRRRAGWVGPGAVDLIGVVAGDVDHLRVGRLDDDGLCRGWLLDDHGVSAGLRRGRRWRGRGCGFDGDRLLFVRLQVAGCLGLAAQALDRIHHRVGLGEEGVTYPLHPGRVLAKGGQRGGEGDQRLHARVPRLVGDLAHCFVATDIRVRLGPGHRIGDVARIGRGHQHLGEQRVGIQRQRREHLVELFGAEDRFGWCWCWCGRRGSRWCRGGRGRRGGGSLGSLGGRRGAAGRCLCSRRLVFVGTAGQDQYGEQG
ncbi:hypothetical protein D3C81_908790 [compost metagenome]